MNLDALGQWDQAQHGGFNDWHPVIYTLFIYAVTRIHNDFAFYIFVQILLFSISIGYLSIAVNKLKVPKYCLIMLVLYIPVLVKAIKISSYLKDESDKILYNALYV